MLFPNLLLRYWSAANYNYLLNRVTKYTLVIHMYHIISDEIGTHKGKFKNKAIFSKKKYIFENKATFSKVWTILSKIKAIPKYLIKATCRFV